MEELVYLEPRTVFDPMIIGIASKPYAIVYDLDAMIEHWATEFQDEETDEDRAYEMAWEWYEFNVLGAYWGEHTPIYVSKKDHDLIPQENQVLEAPRLNPITPPL